MSERLENIERSFETIVATLPEYQISGRLQRAAGMLLEASGLELPVGARCELQLPEGTVPAEVTGFNGDRSFLMPLARLHGAFPGARVVAAGELRFPPCMDLLGRVINALGEPLDGRPLGRRTHTLQPGEPINPLHRRAIDESLDVGIRSINGLLRVGVGQRLGLFAGSGVGKSVLLGMLARFTAADVVVVGLIGERGREVSEFVADNLGAGLSRAVVVAAPADDSPALRLRGAMLATQLAEQFRDQGKRVLLLMDSLTRVAQAQREIGLSMGEPTTAKGYTPSAFSILPRLVERSGQTTSSPGSVTAFYSVLMEEDDLQDPVVDASRAILDGHILLNRRFADRGHYPAIDVEGSVSRLLGKLLEPRELELTHAFRASWGRYAEQEDLINVGAYQPGADPETDLAIKLQPELLRFLRQSPDERVSLADSQADLAAMLASKPPASLAVEAPQAAP